MRKRRRKKKRKEKKKRGKNKQSNQLVVVFEIVNINQKLNGKKGVLLLQEIDLLLLLVFISVCLFILVVYV